jgi:hypothetical protein
MDNSQTRNELGCGFVCANRHGPIKITFVLNTKGLRNARNHMCLMLGQAV